MAWGYTLEAEYESGYIHRETEDDHSPYVAGKNIFNDILEKRPEKPHGKMVRLSLVGETKRYDIDWKTLPANARPIYFREMQNILDGAGNSETSCLKHTFGYQYNDKKGRNNKEVIEVS